MEVGHEEVAACAAAWQHVISGQTARRVGSGDGGQVYRAGTCTRCRAGYSGAYCIPPGRRMAV